MVFMFATLLLCLQSYPAPSQTDGWTAMGDNIYLLFLFVMSNGQVTGFNGTDAAWGGFFSIISYALICAYVCLILVVLLNLLVAMMGDTYSDVQTETEMQYIKSKAQILLSLEGEMSTSDWAALNPPYWIMDGGKPWLQSQLKNDAFLKKNEAETVAKARAAAAADIAAVSEQKTEDAFKTADSNGDGKVSEEELAKFEASIRQKVELEVLARLAIHGPVGGAEPAASSSSSLYVKPSELKGSGFAREGVFSADGAQ